MKLIYSLVLLTSLSSLSYTSAVVAKDQAELKHKSYRATKVVPTMRNRVYTQFARAQGIADGGDIAGGLAVLDDVKSRVDSLNGYERAMLFNFYAFIHYSNDDIKNASLSFKEVVSDEKSIPNTLLVSTLYSLAQLSMQQQDYKTTLSYLTKWQKTNAKPLTASQEILFAQVHYQSKDFKESLKHIQSARALLETENKVPKENWLTLERAVHYELAQPEQVTKVLELLVRHYDKDQYWLQLSAMYGEIGQEAKQMAVMEAAYQAGYVTKASDILMLAQLYLYHGAPYKSAALVEESIDLGNISADEDNLSVLARAYLAAKEDEKAITVLTRVNQISDKGEHAALLAQTYLNTEQWQSAIEVANKAITRLDKKDNAKTMANMYLVKGMANFNLKHFEPALTAFNQASRFTSTQKTAQQWGKYVEREQESHRVQLAMLN